jgi:hypothetical protein
MKRSTLFLVLTALIVVPAMAERVTPETARKVATTFLNNNGAKSNQLVDLSKAAGFANLYIFTTESSFVVMSADDCVKPILGYSLTGSFAAEGLPENIRWWLQGYCDQIQRAIDNNLPAEASVKEAWYSLKSGAPSNEVKETVVGPLLSTLWDQTYPYNYSCPTCSSGGSGGHVYTGCVATAMAQVLKYWNHPATGNGSHTYTHSTYGEQTANFGETTYDWDNMPNSLSTNSSQLQIDAVATLIYHCGVAVEMNYGTGSSSAYSLDVPQAFIDYFNLSPSTAYVSRDEYEDTQWIAFLKNELNESRPLYYCGNNESSGHAFVCDGYRSDDYFHFNWGWSGSDGNYGNSHGNNGYWAIGSLSPGAGGSGSGSGTYNLYNAVIAWAEPLSSLESPYISATATDGAIVLDWDAIIDAVSYNIYRDNVRIATNVTENNYADEDVISGTYYEYYVRAVSVDTISNPSNRVKLLNTYRDFSPSNLLVSYNGNNASLNWTSVEVPPFDIHYCIEPNYYAIGTHDYTNGTYWGQRFPASMIAPFFGMEITKISSCFYFASNYSLYVFNGSLTEADKIHEQNFTKTNTAINWMEFVFTEPLSIDCSKDLWIVFYNNDEHASDPALHGNYNDENASDVRHMSTSLETLSTETTTNKTISWLIRAYLSDGTYTYNLYDGTSTVASNIEGTSYTINNIADNTAHQYTVKTNYYAGLSEASNVAGLALGTASINGNLCLGSNDKMTVTEGSTLTVSGDVINDNPDNLILENGAQLIHNNENVKATVLKDIARYTSDDNGWNFIASPVMENITPSESNGFLNGTLGQNNNTYDLYYYDEPNQLWKNYENQSFVIENKKGYLYANGETNGTTLEFVGTLLPSNNDVTISNLSHEATDLNGFNLVGNPFACNATINQDCYVIEGNQVILANGSKVFAPCEGAFVKATSSNNYAVTFSQYTGAKAFGKDNCLDLVITQGKATTDRARVRLNNGIGMEKFSLNDKHSQISLWQDGQDFAVAYTNGVTEMPVSFRASKNGTYTLTLEAGNFDMDYLHLIDNLTGNDVDLLVTPSYTFEAKYSDYPSRFKLVFASVCEDADSDNENFAFINNGTIVVNQEGTLQIVDLTGRMIYQGDAKHGVSTNDLALGVYVLRLITVDGVKTQKIVVE